MTTWRRNVAAAAAGVLIGGLAGAGVVSASGVARPVVACAEAGTGAVLTGVDCRPAGVAPSEHEEAR